MSRVVEDILALSPEEEEVFGFGENLEEVFSPAEVEPMDMDSHLGGGEGLLSATQAVAVVEDSSEPGSARESASSLSSWYDQVLEEEREAAAQAGGHEGPWTQGLHHPSGESSHSLPMDGVELGQD